MHSGRSASPGKQSNKLQHINESWSASDLHWTPATEWFGFTRDSPSRRGRTTLAEVAGGPRGARAAGRVRAEEGELLTGRVQASREPRGWPLPAADWGGWLKNTHTHTHIQDSTHANSELGDLIHANKYKLWSDLLPQIFNRSGCSLFFWTSTQNHKNSPETLPLSFPVHSEGRLPQCLSSPGFFSSRKVLAECRDEALVRCTCLLSPWQLYLGNSRSVMDTAFLIFVFSVWNQVFFYYEHPAKDPLPHTLFGWGAQKHDGLAIMAPVNRHGKKGDVGAWHEQKQTHK